MFRRGAKYLSLYSGICSRISRGRTTKRTRITKKPQLRGIKKRLKIFPRAAKVLKLVKILAEIRGFCLN